MSETMIPSRQVLDREPGTGSEPIVRRAVLAAGLLGIAAIHVADLPGKIDETPYLAWLYAGLVAACIVIAELVARRPHRLVFAAAAALAAATFAGFVLTRTTGLPGATDDIGNWSEPLGLVSLLVEALVFWWAFQGMRLARSRHVTQENHSPFPA